MNLNCGDILKVLLEKNICIVIRESQDPKIYGIKNASGESRLLYLVQQELKKQGFDVIKKRMCKDGHLVDEMQQYIRTRKGAEPSFEIYNSRWAIRGAEEPFNKGKVELSVIRDIWN